MKKNIVFIISIISTSFLLSMDTPPSPPTPLTINEDNPSVTIPVDGHKQPQSSTPPGNLPALDFTKVNRSVSRKPVNIMTQRKAVVSNQTHVGDLARAKSVYGQKNRERQQESSKRSGDRRKLVEDSHRAGSGGSSGKKEIINDNPRTSKISDSPNSTVVGIDDLMRQITEDIYHEEDMWDLLSVVNPVLHDFAVQRGLTLSQAQEYGQAMQDFDFKPTALIQFLKSHSGFKDNRVDSFEINQYKEIRKDDPRKYKMLLLELIEKVWAAEENAMTNNSQGTLMHNTHLGVQADQIEDQKTRILYRTIMFIGTLIYGLGSSAWAIYGQANGNCTAT